MPKLPTAAGHGVRILTIKAVGLSVLTTQDCALVVPHAQPLVMPTVINFLPSPVLIHHRLCSVLRTAKYFPAEGRVSSPAALGYPGTADAR